MGRLATDIRALWRGEAKLETGIRTLVFGGAALWLLVLPSGGDTFALARNYATINYLAARAHLPALGWGPLCLAPGELLWWALSAGVVTLSVTGYATRGLGPQRAYAYSIYYGVLAAMQLSASPTSYGGYLWVGFALLSTWAVWRAAARGGGHGGD